MVIQTKYHGEIEVHENEIIQFQSGLPGFLEEKQFVLLTIDKESPFLILQSIQTEELGFVVVNPFLFIRDYGFKLSEGEKEILKIETESDIQIYSILTIKEPFEESTANLQGPIILNGVKQIAKQVILSHSPYTTRHKLFAETTIK
ncbi:flagellar assembly protein FliW [Bacillus sp. JJ1566]|uniref:flagellar assembly protein FliW n=1 Tax=Bacillus sp. JJ1566 TaxID=3122961 RepID=UPI00300016AB